MSKQCKAKVDGRLCKNNANPRYKDFCGLHKNQLLQNNSELLKKKESLEAKKRKLTEEIDSQISKLEGEIDNNIRTYNGDIQTSYRTTQISG